MVLGYLWVVNDIVDRTYGKIRVVIFSLSPNKAPDPNGFTTNFYKKVWHIIKSDCLNI
jgi:hypothetical protein